MTAFCSICQKNFPSSEINHIEGVNCCKNCMMGIYLTPLVSQKRLTVATDETKKSADLINHPPHYQGNGLECIQVIEAFGLGFNLGNAIKYILRAEKKASKRDDLLKAEWYINRELNQNGNP